MIYPVDSVIHLLNNWGLKDKGGERPRDICSSNFSAQVVLKLERSMMGHFVILIENIIQLIVIIITTIIITANQGHIRVHAVIWRLDNPW